MRHLLVMVISFIIVGCITLTAQTETPTQCNICPPTNIELRAPVYNEEGRFLGIYKAYIPKGSLPAGKKCPDKEVKVKTDVFKDKNAVNHGEVLIKKGWLDDPSHYKVIGKIPKIPKYKYKPKKMIIVPPDNMTHWHVELNKN